MSYPISIAQFTRKVSSRLIDYVLSQLKPRAPGPWGAKLFDNDTIVVIESAAMLENLGKTVMIHSPVLCLVAADKDNRAVYFAPGEIYVVMGEVTQTDGGEIPRHSGNVSLALGQNLRPANPIEIADHLSSKA